VKLYHFPLSPYCRKALLAFYEKDLDFESVVVDLRRPDALQGVRHKRNPFGKLPYLIDEQGDCVSESSVIVEYIDGAYGCEPRLIPDDRELARKARWHDRLTDLYLLEPCERLANDISRRAAGEDNSGVHGLIREVQTAMRLFDEELRGKNHLVNNRLTIGDLSLSCAVVNLAAMGVRIAQWPHLQRWLDRILDRPSWRRIMAESEPYSLQPAMA